MISPCFRLALGLLDDQGKEGVREYRHESW